MRVTSKPSFQSLSHSWRNSKGDSEAFASSHTHGTSSVRDDVRTGNRITPLPYSATFSEIGPVNGFLTWHRWFLNGSGMEHDYWQTPLSYYTPSFPALPDPKLLAEGMAGLVNTRLLSKAVSATNNIILTIADRKKTADLAVSMAQSVYSLTRSFVQRDWEDVRHALTGAVGRNGKVPKQQLRAIAKASADRHLAFIYGVLPVISEVNGLLQLNSRPLIGKVRARETETRVFTHGHTAARLNPSPLSDRREDWVPAVIRRDVTREMSARGVLRFEIHSSAVDHAAQLGVLSPRFAMYDQIALSFVAGWFSNIGSYLIALDSGLSVEAVSYSTTTRVLDVTTIEAYPLYPKGIKEVYSWTTPVTHAFSGGASSVATTTTYSRVVGTKPPASLHIRDGFSTFAGLAAVSLITQRYIGRLRKLQTLAPSTQRAFRYRPIRVKTLRAITYRKP